MEQLKIALLQIAPTDTENGNLEKGIAACNYPETVPDCNGHSSAFDGAAYLPDLTDSWDTCLLEADGEEPPFVREEFRP